MGDNVMELLESLINGFIDSDHKCDPVLLPRLLVNDNEKGEKIITSIVNELLYCDEFLFSVAFLTVSGVQVLLSTLIKAEEKGIKGTIIVSQYQNFTEPKALRKLKLFKNIQLRIVTEDKSKMHAKGYIFKKGKDCNIIVGSSNLTQNALCANTEWNVKLCSKKTGSYYIEVLKEFQNIYDLSIPVNDAFIDKYEQVYNESLARIKYVGLEPVYNEIKPNIMQQDALERLTNIRKEGAARALVISATGTGKTYLSAFDVKQFKPKKFLFIVHREQIAKDAMASYKRVLGQNISCGFIGAGKFAVGQYNFAMIQTLSKNNVLQRFKPDEFDYILCDEIQHGGSKQMQKVIDYFKPLFLLGMTATPERMDGFDIYKMFNYNIAYEIRLQDAVREEMICPFHYYGIADLTVDGEIIDDNTSFNRLIDSQRVKHIIDKIKLYGYQGDRVKGLIFVSRIEEAEKLSEAFNQRGYKTVALSGQSTQEEREECIKKLEQTNREDGLDYIFSVDIFNEGIDIPLINQIVMLRPTQSAVIFVQQLGRGLRKAKNKEYVVVLDFIGNYENNFLIPIALSGDNTYNKDTIRHIVREGNSLLHGASTIEFDSVAESKIYASIDKANFNASKLIRESYTELKQKLGRIPSIRDFDDYGAIDIMRIVDKYGSYYQFLKKIEPEYKVELDTLEEKYVQFISKKFLCGKRPNELEFLNICLHQKDNLLNSFVAIMKELYPKITVDQATIKNHVNQMTQNYLSGSEKTTYQGVNFIDQNNDEYVLNASFAKSLKNKEFFGIVSEILDNGLYRYDTIYKNNYEQTSLKLYGKYTYEDACRGLNWYKNPVARNIGGYKYDKDTNTFPVFVNYDKKEDIQDTIKYEDRFISPSSFIAISKAKRNLSSADIKVLKNAEKTKTKVLLFVRKNKDDKISKEFYFLGEVTPNNMFKEITMSNTNVSAVEIGYNLVTPVRSDIYDYITN